MGKSRFHYAVLNMGISGTTTFLKMALSLIVRTIFIYYLGSKVLCLNSLLISILTTLSAGCSLFMDVDSAPLYKRIRDFYGQVSDNAFVIGSNFGPVYNQPMIQWYKKVFQNFDFVTWRDTTSEKKELIDARKQTTLPDVVLGLNVDNVATIDGQFVLFNLMNIGDVTENTDTINEYLKSVVFNIKLLVSQGERVKLVSIDKDGNDKKFVSRVKREFFSNVDQVLSLFKSSKAVVATRYHSLILAWLFEKPVVSIAYSDKTTNFINTWYPQQKVITLDELSEKMDIGVMQETEIPVEKLTFLKTQAKKHFDSLGAALNSEMG
ncbi:polysaccharide pyruvyl transferase family protein [Weissella cibaria]|uniref:polysaccharide pyruvyl transferase family protein n=1 Tax=Weissella cibaria TaxID=137591 RepID=UPI0011975AF9|nr:polysaccharide pyruvyl transferase family protein [Weissella cibaria]TVV26442.1 polysaccharide pyruvyl transferase family protein [Weissella cibaria]